MDSCLLTSMESSLIGIALAVPMRFGAMKVMSHVITFHCPGSFFSFQGLGVRV